MKQTPSEKLHIVLGLVKDKDPEKLLALLPNDAEYYFVRAAIPRALEEKELARLATGFGLTGLAYSSVLKAFDTARSRAGKNDMVFVGGSTFVVAEIL
jgi:dihydrofolate synthase/folylpolyglutamate synthase